MMADETPFLDFYQREDGLFDWRLVAENGRELCSSEQGYTSEANAREGFDATVRALRQLGL
jgi:uncharacterized protein YegP (UPF0339 family)